MLTCFLGNKRFLKACPLGIRGFKSRTSHFSVLDFGDLSTNLSTNSVFARKFVYKHQIFVYNRSYICLQRISTAIPSLGSSCLNQAGSPAVQQQPVHSNKNKELETRCYHLFSNKRHHTHHFCPAERCECHKNGGDN